MKSSLEVVKSVLDTLSEHGIVLVNASEVGLDAIAAKVGAENKRNAAALAYALKATFDPKKAEGTEFSLRCRRDLQAVVSKHQASNETQTNGAD